MIASGLRWCGSSMDGSALQWPSWGGVFFMTGGVLSATVYIWEKWKKREKNKKNWTVKLKSNKSNHWNLVRHLTP